MLGAPTWRDLGTLVVETDLFKVMDPVEPFSHPYLFDVEPGDYIVKVGYQSLLGSRVGKLAFLRQGFDFQGLFSGMPMKVTRDGEAIETLSLGPYASGILFVGPASLVGDDLELFRDKCRAAVSTNEQVGIIDGRGVATTMCLKPEFTGEYSRAGVLLNFSAGY